MAKVAESSTSAFSELNFQFASADCYAACSVVAVARRAMSDLAEAVNRGEILVDEIDVIEAVEKGRISGLVGARFSTILEEYSKLHGSTMLCSATPDHTLVFMTADFQRLFFVVILLAGVLAWYHNRKDRCKRGFWQPKFDETFLATFCLGITILSQVSRA